MLTEMLKNKAVAMMAPNSGCKLADGPIINKTMFAGVFDQANGNVCDGCSHNSNCSAKSKFINYTGDPRLKQGPTNAELAKKHGISKRQASKMRAAGIFEEV